VRNYTSESESRSAAECNSGAGPAIQGNAITHRYGSRVALDSVSFSIPPATAFALLGPNGGGKTTLFRILTTALVPTAGTAKICGADVVRERDRVRRRIGVAFQRPSLDAKLTVAENLIHHGHLYGTWGPALKRRVGEVLERFAMNERARDKIETLSGGLQRRVELAKALLHRPEVLILDEPGTGLDPAARLSLLNVLDDLRDRDGVTALLSTHLIDEAERCDLVGIIDRGRWIATGRPAELKERIGGDVLNIKTNEPRIVAATITERYSIEAKETDGAVRICHEGAAELVPELMNALGKRIDSISVGRPTLADVFMSLTGRRFSGESTGEE